MLTRRDFIKTMGLIGGVLLAPVQRLGGWLDTRSNQTEDLSDWELYAGFVLLPEGVPAPSFISCVSTPIICQVGHESDAVEKQLKGESVRYESLDQLRSDISFQTYDLTTLPKSMEFIGATIVRFSQSREIFKTRIDFGPDDNKQPLISLWIQPNFPQPFPIWPIFEKVAFTPQPGVMLTSARGYVFNWINNHGLYTLVVENDPTLEEAITIVKSLETH